MSALRFREFEGISMTTFAPKASRRLEKDYWCVMNTFTYYTGEKEHGRTVTVEKGYLTDGATVPPVFWSIIPPWGQYGQAVIVHDILCERLTLDTPDGPVKITREECDHILKEAMQVLGVPSWKIAIIYGGVALYRKVFRVRKPECSPKKKAVEEAIRHALDKGLDFEFLVP